MVDQNLIEQAALALRKAAESRTPIDPIRTIVGTESTAYSD